MGAGGGPLTEVNGILDGMLENNHFDPKANIKRGEVASMLYHYLSNNASDQPKPSADGKTLAAYFSATNTTRPLVEYASDILNADLYEIVPEDPYTDADLAYYTNGRADREQNDASARPAISSGVEAICVFPARLPFYEKPLKQINRLRDISKQFLVSVIASLRTVTKLAMIVGIL